MFQSIEHLAKELLCTVLDKGEDDKDLALSELATRFIVWAAHPS